MNKTAKTYSWVIALLLTMLGAAQATTIVKNSSTGSLNGTGDWTGGVAPSTGDIAEWNSTSATGSLSLGGSVAWGEIQIVNPSSAVTFAASSTLTLDGVSGIGIDMSSASQDLTLDCALTLGGAQTWNVGSGATLTLGGSAAVNNSGDLLTIAGAGTINIGTAISGAGGLTMAGSGTLSLTAADTYSGATIVSGGTLSLSGSGAIASSSGITIDSGATLTEAAVSGGNLLKDTATMTMNGGTFAFTHGSGNAQYSETVGTLSLNSGDSTISTDVNSASGGSKSSIFTFASLLSRTVGATVNFGGGTGNPSSASDNNDVVFTTAPTLLNGIIGGWATVGGTDWATYTSSGTPSVGALASYSANGFAANANSDITSSQGPSANININSLRFNTAAAVTLTLSGSANVIQSGGILVTPTVANNASTITGGTLEGANGNDLVVIQNNTANTLTIGSIIANNTSATALTKSGAGQLILTGANTYTGSTFINGGTLQVGAGSTAGALGSGSMTDDGTVSFDLSSTYTQSAAISGTGSLSQIGTGELDLNHANSYSGGTTLTHGSIKAGATGALGSGGINFNGGTLKMNGYSATVGALTLSASSTLDLTGGSAGESLTFTTGSLTSGTLTVDGWTGANGSSGTGYQIFATGAFSTALLNAINFQGFTSGSYELPSGEIIPVPEPITWALLIFCGVVGAVQLGQRAWRTGGKRA
jgi:autotransporter-associated beta strand protein